MPQLAVCADTATVSLHNALHQGQAQASALKFALAMEAFERGEQIVAACGIKAHTIVLHGHAHTALSQLGCHPHQRPRSVA